MRKCEIFQSNANSTVKCIGNLRNHFAQTESFTLIVWVTNFKMERLQWKCACKTKSLLQNNPNFFPNIYVFRNQANSVVILTAWNFVLYLLEKNMFYEYLIQATHIQFYMKKTSASKDPGPFSAMQCGIIGTLQLSH